MRPFIFSFVMLAACLGSSGCTDSQTQSGTIIKNCTGSYLRFDDTVYKLCNPEIIESYQSGEIISVVLRYDQCIDAYACNLHYTFEEWIEILEIE